MKTQRSTDEYLKILKDLKTILTYNPKSSIAEFISKNKLSKNFAQIITNGGLVKNTGGVGKSSYWIWNTIEPNYHMAEELQKRIKELGRDLNQKYRQPKRLCENKIIDKTTEIKNDNKFVRLVKTEKIINKSFFGKTTEITFFYYEKI